MRCPLSTILVLVCLGSSATAEALDGLYKPSGTDWSCSPNDVGLDGGALAIWDGVLEGVDNRCELTNPQKVSNGTMFTAICNAEGQQVRETITFRPTANGVAVKRNSSTSYWVKCPMTQGAATSVTTASGQWSYDGNSATVFASAVGFAVSCEPLTASSTYPVASIYGVCPACISGDARDFTITTDQGFSRTYPFELVSQAAGWQSDLDYAPTWYDEPITALMAGQMMTISDGTAVVAQFSLNGSSAALSALRDDCN